MGFYLYTCAGARARVVLFPRSWAAASKGKAKAREREIRILSVFFLLLVCSDLLGAVWGGCGGWGCESSSCALFSW